MSLQAALAFLQHLRQTPEAATAEHLQELLERARRSGYDFTEDELRAAFKHDWAMRWMHHTRRDAASPGVDPAGPSG